MLAGSGTAGSGPVSEGARTVKFTLVPAVPAAGEPITSRKYEPAPTFEIVAGTIASANEKVPPMAVVPEPPVEVPAYSAIVPVPSAAGPW